MILLDRIFWIGVILVVIVGGMFWPIMSNEKKCAEELGVEYSFWESFQSIGSLKYEFIDKNHFNCCYDSEVFLDDQGAYQTERICRGFVKDE